MPRIHWFSPSKLHISTFGSQIILRGKKNKIKERWEEEERHSWSLWPQQNVMNYIMYGHSWANSNGF